MPLSIGGKVIDPEASAPAPQQSGPRLKAIVMKARFAVVLDGQEIVSGPSTIGNLEMIADLLSAYGYPDQAEALRRGKHIA